jgi:membrane protease YdiL (CAAX protease family)
MASSDAQSAAIDKLSQCIPIVLSIILLTKLSGDDLGSIFLKKGNLQQGLKFGFISFGIFAAIFVVIAILQSNAPSSKGMTASGVSLNTIVSAIPWILVFIFANSLMEELWFRGISLRKLSPLLGMTASVVVTALVFGIPHLGATYIAPTEMIIFPIIVFALGLVNGFVMLKTDSIWGSVLFHAGYDLIVIIPVLVSVQ